MRKSVRLLMATGFVCLLGVSIVSAANPIRFVTGFFRGKETVEADPNKEYTLNELNGPWMICAMTFSGDDAKSRAMELSYELRKRYKLRAYIHEQVFDHTKDVDLFEDMKRDQYAPKKQFQTGNVTRDWAVLVGDFQSISDNDINDTLKRIKSGAVSPECLKRGSESGLMSNGSVGETVKSFRMEARREYGNDNTAPLSCALKTPNPILPKDYFVRDKQFLDDFVVSLNSDTPYSVLRCRGKYTIMVAQFTGKMYVRPSEIEEIESGKKEMESKLEQAGVDAEKLCEALRQKGYTAFTFHDRSASIVTVGEFNYLGEPLSDGFTNYTDEIARIIKTFSGQPNERADFTAGESAYLVKSIIGIPLLPQPVPIETPKQRPRQAMR